MTALAMDSGRKTPARLASSAILAMQSDERLVELVRAGHERAFDAIVQRYRKHLIAFCGRILPESRCEDAVQQAFINAHAALIGSDEDVQLKPWLYAIARNAALNMLRQNGWNYDQIPLEFDGVRRPDQVFEQRIELEQTVAALHELPDRQRDALVMREFEGRSYAEIAVALGANDGAVRQLLNRARVTLRGAASLLLPPPLVARAAASLQTSDGRRVTELFAGMGAAGVAKAGATALVAGTLVVGAVEAPLPIGGSHREKTIVPAQAGAARHQAGHDSTVALQPRPKTGATRPRHASSHAPSTGQRHEGERRARAEREHSGTSRRSGGSDDGTTRDRRRSGGGSGSSGSSGGSDDTSRSSITTDDHGGASGSGTGGSGTSGSTTSGSGTSGSGSGSSDSGDGSSGTSTSGTSTSGSGTSGSGTSGSGTSGSGSSGSGSGDTLTTTTTTADSSGRSGSSGGSDSLDH